MGEVALTEEPLEVAVGCGADVVAAEGWTLVAVAARVGFVALGAVVRVDEGAGGDSLRLASEGIGASAIFGWDVIPVGVDSGGEGQCGEEGDG